MIKLSLDTNPYLKQRLSELGFLKKRGTFMRIHNEMLQMIDFLHYCKRGERQTRYYSVQYSFTYSPIECIGLKLGYYLYATSGQLRTRNLFSSGLNHHLEWRIAGSDSEKRLYQQIDDIVETIQKRLFPIFDRYPTMGYFVRAVEKGLLQKELSYDSRWLAIIYRLLGEENKAQQYIGSNINYLVNTRDQTKIMITKDYFDATTSCNSSVSLNHFLNFVKRFNETKDDKSIWLADYKDEYPFSIDYNIPNTQRDS